MITLQIFYADGRVYWTEYFNTMQAAQAWIADEQTRPYWNSAWTFTIVDTRPVL